MLFDNVTCVHLARGSSDVVNSEGQRVCGMYVLPLCSSGRTPSEVVRESPYTWCPVESAIDGEMLGAYQSGPCGLRQAVGA